MKTLLINLTLLMFLLWLMPLGGFVKPAQQQSTCGGQRAICLCTDFVKAKAPKGQGKVIGVAGQATQKEAPGPSAGASHDFLRVIQRPMVPVSAGPSFVQPVHVPALMFIRSIEHVPRA